MRPDLMAVSPNLFAPEPGRTSGAASAQAHGAQCNAPCASAVGLNPIQSVALLLVARDILRHHKILAPSVSDVLAASGPGRSHFRDNPRRAGKKIWEVDFFTDGADLRPGNYSKW